MNDPARGESSPDGGFRRGGGNATRAASIGHVHLKVAALDRALAFDHGVLGFEITQRSGPTPRSSPPGDTTITSG